MIHALVAHFRRSAVLVLAVLMLSGCSLLRAAAPVLDRVSLAIADAEAVLSVIQAVEAEFFAVRPDAATQATIERDIAVARSSLSAAADATVGVKDLSQGDVDAAFAPFRKAYGELEQALAAAGVTAAAANAARVGTARPPLQIHRPIALTLRVAS